MDFRSNGFVIRSNGIIEAAYQDFNTIKTEKTAYEKWLDNYNVDGPREDIHKMTPENRNKLTNIFVNLVDKGQDLRHPRVMEMMGRFPPEQEFDILVKVWEKLENCGATIRMAG